MTQKAFGSERKTTALDNSPKSAIVGCGSIGTAIGAFLTSCGADIDFVDNNPSRISSLKEKGIRLRGKATLDIGNVNAIYPEEMTPGYDIILLATKVKDNGKIVPLLGKLLKDDGVILTLQDGLPELQISEIVGSSRTMGCTVEWGATLLGDGTCEVTSEADYLSVHIGKMPGVPQYRVEQVRSFMERASVVDFETDLKRARWTKLLVNCSVSAVGAIIGGTFGDVCSGDAQTRRVCLESMNECMDVGFAYGASFSPIQGEDLVEEFHCTSQIKKWVAMRRLPEVFRNHTSMVPSMLQDIRRGEPCEAQAINGLVAKFGRELGVPTPVNDKILEIIAKEQEGEILPSKDNISLFFQ